MIKQFVKEDFCLKCLGCCRFREKNSLWSPQLLKEEASSLEQAVELVFDPGQNIFLCSSFVPADNECKVYTLRPFECQLYPFLLNKRSENIFLAVDLNCPFVKERFDTDEFKDYVEYLAEFFNENAQVLRNNPQLIQSYREVQDLIEINI